MDDKFKCNCMKQDDGDAIEQAAARIEIGMEMFLSHACPTMAALATARVCGSALSQCDNMAELREEVIRQLDIGIAYGQKMVAEMDGNLCQ